MPLSPTQVALAWTNADPTLPTQVHRSTDGVTFFQVQTATAGASAISDDPHASGTFYYAVCHVASDGTRGTFSNVATVTK